MSQPTVVRPVVECPVAQALATGGAALGEPDLIRAADGLGAPVLVEVTGRPGAGRTTVARVLRAAGIRVAARGERPEVSVYVFVERFTPEDRAAMSAVGYPCVAVLNKADLAGFRGAGPMATATARCRALERTRAAPVVPLAALLAQAVLGQGLSDVLFDGLAALARGASAPEIRSRLLAELDFFGVAVAVAALRAGADRAAVAEELRQISGVDVLMVAVECVIAEVRYLRAMRALASLAGRAAGPDGGQIAEFLSGDAVVGARMACAAVVVQSVGLPVGTGRTADEHLRAAVLWQRYADGPVSELHRACGAEIARGALRLWARA